MHSGLTKTHDRAMQVLADKLNLANQENALLKSGVKGLRTENLHFLILAQQYDVEEQKLRHDVVKEQAACYQSGN